MKRLTWGLGILAIIGFASWSNAAPAKIVLKMFEPSSDHTEKVAGTLRDLKIPVTPKDLKPILAEVSSDSNLYFYALRENALKYAVFIHGPNLIDFVRAPNSAEGRSPGYRITKVDEQGVVETLSIGHAGTDLRSMETAEGSETEDDDLGRAKLVLDIVDTIERRMRAGRRSGNTYAQERGEDAKNYYFLRRLFDSR
jgi:hypothetical protein